MIPGPTAADNPTDGDEWFATNHRGFSMDPAATSKLETNFILVMDGNSAKVEKIGSKPIHFSGKSEKLNPINGQTIETKDGSLKTATIGNPAVAGDQVQVIFQSAAVNPFAPPIISPSIDYTLDLIFDRSKRKMTMNGTIGEFPAFEVYASLNGMPMQKVFNENPTGKTAWALYDFDLKALSRNVDATVGFTEFAGTWESSDQKNRFRLEIGADNKCQWIERSAIGELKRPAELKMNPSNFGIFVIERANTDTAVLTFLGFAPTIQPAILGANPKPSFMTLSRDGAVLKGGWNGITVIKDIHDKFSQLKQPGDLPSKEFEFHLIP